MKHTKNIDYWIKTLKNPPQSYIKLFEQEAIYLKKNIQKGQKVLDVGCGEGKNILSIADITDDIIGLDIDPKAVEITKINTANYSKIKVVLGSVTEIPYKDGIFDVVIFFMTLVNLDSEKDKAISEMKRVAKDEAKIIISVYSEKALEERMNMYEQVEVPIVSEINGKLTFGIEGFVSEQFSIQDIKNLVEPLGLKIDTYEEVEGLAYIITLKKVL